MQPHEPEQQVPLLVDLNVEQEETANNSAEKVLIIGINEDKAQRSDSIGGLPLFS
jgi:hypothetical protein